MYELEKSFVFNASLKFIYISVTLQWYFYLLCFYESNSISCSSRVVMSEPVDKAPFTPPLILIATWWRWYCLDFPWKEVLAILERKHLFLIVPVIPSVNKWLWVNARLLVHEAVIDMLPETYWSIWSGCRVFNHWKRVIWTERNFSATANIACIYTSA